MLPVLTVLSAAQNGIRGFRGLALDLDRLLSIALNTGACLAALVGVALVAPSLQEAVHGTAFTLLPWWGSFAIWVIASFACRTVLGAPRRLSPYAIGCSIVTGLVQTTLLKEVGMLLLVTGAIGVGVVLGQIVGRGAVHRYGDFPHPPGGSGTSRARMPNVGAAGAGLTTTGGEDTSRPSDPA
ncbi:hypothetical protein ACF06N_09510 [Streptomyces albidoflavus]